MRSWLRRPLFWLVLVEFGLVLALLSVAWRVYEARQVGGVVAPAPASTAIAPTATPSPVPAVHPSSVASPVPRVPAAKPTPSFPVDVAEVNRQQASLERLQAGLLAKLMDAARAYLERVVLPAVRRAESASSANTAAAAQSPAAMRKMP